MACKIEIQKTIEKSIAKATENDYRGFTKQQSQKIVNYLNDLWGNIAEAVESTGQGSYRIITNIDNILDNEYNKQTASESQFERDFDFFNGDSALLEQDQKENEQIENYTKQDYDKEIKEILANNFKNLNLDWIKKSTLKELSITERTNILKQQEPLLEEFKNLKKLIKC